MEQNTLHALLSALQEPAFIAENQAVKAGNEAFHALHIADGTPLSAFFTAPQGPLGGEPFDCTVGAEHFRASVVPLDSAVLYILRPPADQISTHILAHSAKRLRAVLQQMYSALDTLDLQLLEGDEKSEASMCSLLQGVFRLERMANNLEYLQRLSSGEYKLRLLRMDLYAELRQLLEKAESLLREAKIELRWSLPSGAFQGSMDRSLLSLAVWNLIANAAANAGGGTVRVEVERVRLTRLRIKVTDSGQSISSAQLPNLMQRYSVPAEEAVEQPGVGAGLSLVRAVAQRFGGSLAISVEPGGATTAAIVLDTGLPADPTLHSDVAVFARSLDEGLVGLSDVLPRTIYDRRDILS